MGTFSHKALILEDEVFIVMDVEEALAAAGIGIAASFSTNRAAVAWLLVNKPDVAVIDYRLKDGTSEATLAVLTTLGVPTVIYSGNRLDDDDTRFSGATAWVDKPATPDQLTTAILAAIHSQSLSEPKPFSEDR